MFKTTEHWLQKPKNCHLNMCFGGDLFKEIRTSVQKNYTDLPKTPSLLFSTVVSVQRPSRNSDPEGMLHYESGIRRSKNPIRNGLVKALRLLSELRFLQHRCRPAEDYDRSVACI